MSSLIKLNEIIKLRKSFCLVRRPTDNKYLLLFDLNSLFNFLRYGLYIGNIFFLEIKSFLSEFPDPLELVIILSESYTKRF